nr:site-specific integrase [Brevundimonas bacteroides]
MDAKWENVDLERRSWLIPTSKTAKPCYVPLSSAAVAIIEQLPRFKGCPYLLPNPDTKKPFNSIKNGWQKAIRDAKLPGLRLHDLRHFAASFMVNSGVDLFAVGKVLGHASYQSTQRYARLANDTLLRAVEAGAAKQNP